MVRSVHKYMLYYAQKWEEIVQNRSRYEENLLKEFEEIHHLSQGLLCEITLILGHLSRHQHSYRNHVQLESVKLPVTSSSRLLYEYIVLKDYIQALDLILKLFQTVDMSKTLRKD